MSELRQRDPRQRDKAHMGKVARLMCLPCLTRGSITRPVQVCHVKIGYPEAGDGWRAFGHSEKSHDWRTLPMCPRCHQSGPLAQHGNRGGDERAFWDRLGIYPPSVCAALVAAFAAGQNGEAIIRQAARGGYPQRT